MTSNASYNQIKGWLHPLCQATIQQLLLIQNENKISGNLLEIGVYLGKTLSLLAIGSHLNEKVIGIDPFTINYTGSNQSSEDFIQETAENMRLVMNENSAKGELILLKGLSSEGRVISYLKSFRKTFRVISIDGSHKHHDVYGDLCLANSISNNESIIILDDYCNPLNPEVTSALKQFIVDSKEGKEWRLSFSVTPMCSPLDGSSRIFLQKKDSEINYPLEIDSQLSKICEIEKLDYRKYGWASVMMFGEANIPMIMPKSLSNWDIN